jgi:large subunit ribosomal protein L29
MKNIEDLRQMTKQELEAEILELRKQQFKLRLQKANSELGKTHVIKLVRRTIARIKTILSEKAKNED